MKIIFQKIHIEKSSHLIISVVLYSGQYGMFSIIKNNHLKESFIQEWNNT